MGTPIDLDPGSSVSTSAQHPSPSEPPSGPRSRQTHIDRYSIEADALTAPSIACTVSSVFGTRFTGFSPFLSPEHTRSPPGSINPSAHNGQSSGISVGRHEHMSSPHTDHSGRSSSTIRNTCDNPELVSTNPNANTAVATNWTVGSRINPNCSTRTNPVPQD